MLDVVKYAATVLTGIFGLIALLVEYKTKDGKITPWGKLALVGVVLSMILAISSQWLDSANVRRNNNEAAQEKGRLLLELDRAQNPIKDVYVSYAALVPSDPLLESYRTKLDHTLRAIAATYDPRSFDPDLRAKVNVWAWDKEKKPMVMALPALSPLMPSNDEPLAFAVLRYAGIVVSLYAAREPKQNLATPRSDRPDLVWAGTIGPEAYRFAKDIGSYVFLLNYSLSSRTFTFISMRSPQDPQNWSSTGKLTSIRDLVNADMEVKLPKISPNRDYPWVQDYARIKRGVKLEQLTLTIAGQQFSFPGKLFKQVNDRDGQPLFVFHFPETRDGLQRLINTSPALLPGTDS